MLTKEKFNGVVEKSNANNKLWFVQYRVRNRKGGFSYRMNAYENEADAIAFADSTIKIKID